MKIFFVRHGHPIIPNRKRWVIRALATTWRRWTRWDARRRNRRRGIRGLKQGQLIVASPFTRALQTAAVLSRRLDLELRRGGAARVAAGSHVFVYTDVETVERARAEFDAMNGVAGPERKQRWETGTDAHARGTG